MQDYYCLMQSLLSYIEARVGDPPDATDMERVMGISYAHIRDIFKQKSLMPLGKYMLLRRVQNAAFELIHTRKTILQIATEFGFENVDTFTRAFRRVTGLNPSAFRASKAAVGRVKITGGVFGPGIIKKSDLQSSTLMEEQMMNKEQIKDSNSCILYGVHEVKYCCEEATPFPACLRSVLNYLGQEIDYCSLMATTGASFRLRWNREIWDGGNVDIQIIYEDPTEAFTRGFAGAGRTVTTLHREKQTTKADFIGFIRKEIDSGRPLIALGIIGPPEACIITGYRNNGETLLGWNFFQSRPEFGGGNTIDESGYFVTDQWWENPCTTLLMAVGEEQTNPYTRETLLRNALQILTTENVGPYAGGQAAYTLWAEKMTDDREFGPGLPLPQLFERLMCQNDALTMITEGRFYADYFMRYISACYEKESLPEKAEAAAKAAELFGKIGEIGKSMWSMLEGKTEEEQARTLATLETRAKIVPLIEKAAQFEKAAAEQIRLLLE